MARDIAMSYPLKRQRISVKQIIKRLKLWTKGKRQVSWATTRCIWMQRWRRSNNKYSNRLPHLLPKTNLGGLRANRNSNRIRISFSRQPARWHKCSKTKLFRKVGATEERDHRVITTQLLSTNSTEKAIKTPFSNSKKLLRTQSMMNSVRLRTTKVLNPPWMVTATSPEKPTWTRRCNITTHNKKSRRSTWRRTKSNSRLLVKSQLSKRTERSLHPEKVESKLKLIKIVSECPKASKYRRIITTKGFLCPRLNLQSRVATATNE